MFYKELIIYFTHCFSLGGLSQEHWVQGGNLPDGTLVHHPCTHLEYMGNLEYQMYLSVMFLGDNRKLENLRKPTGTWGGHANLCSESNPGSGLNWRPWSCES